MKGDSMARSSKSRGWDTRKVNDDYLEDKNVPKWITGFIKATGCKTLPKLVSAADRLHITKRMIEKALPKAGLKVERQRRWDMLVADALSEEGEPVPQVATPTRATVKPSRAAKALSSEDLVVRLKQHREATHVILNQRMEEEGGLQQRLVKTRLIERITA
jgi:hypothetical protein